MPLDSHFLHSAEIQRATTTLDPYGNGTETWDYQAQVPCRLTEKRERVWSSERQESLAVTAYLLLVPPSTDVRERDRVVVDGVTYTVTAVMTRHTRAAHHKSLTLEVVH